MKQSKLIRHLKHFDQREWKQFGLYLASPFFFNGKIDKKLIGLHEALDRFYPKFNQGKFSEEFLFGHLFPQKPFNKSAFQQVTTKFNKAIEQFIEQVYRPQSFGFPPEGIGLALFYERKKMFGHFEKVYQQLSAQVSKEVVKSPEQLWHNFLLADLLTFHQGSFNLRHTDLNLPETLSSLDYFYLVMKLQLACAFLNQKNHQQPIDVQGGLAAFYAILPLIESGVYQKEPLVDLLYRTYLLLQSDAGIKEYQELKAAFDQYAKQLAFMEQQIIHAALRNFCLSQINGGKEAFMHRLFDLYEQGLALNILYTDGKIAAATFQNMAATGIRLKKFDWVEAFLEEHRNRIISKESPEAFYSLSKALLLFHQNEYEQSLECLRYNYSDTYSKIIARRLEIQLYYEMQSGILESKIQAFKVFVFRSSKSLLTPIQKEGYSNFIDILKQMIHPTTLHNNKRINMIHDKIVAKQTIAEKGWLLTKVKALK